MSSQYAYLRRLAHEGAAQAYRDLLGRDSFAIPKASHFDVDVNDPAVVEKALFAMTVGRAAYARQELLDEKALAKALRESGRDMGELAPGFYLRGPSGEVSAAFSCDADGGSGSREAMEAQMRRLLQAGLADDETYLCAVEIDPERLFAKDNQFAGAVAKNFDNGLAEFGGSAETRQLGQKRALPGYPVAWEARSVRDLPQDLSVADSFDVEVELESLAGIPTINPKGGSAAKNIRDYAPVNWREGHTWPDQPKLRDEIVETLISAWMDQRLISRGLLDQQCGIDPDNYASQALVEKKRRELAGARAGKALGNAKKLSVSVGATALRQNGRALQYVSMDMALSDGQHSSRNYALIAQAMKSTSPPTWEQEGPGTRVENCSQAHFKGLLEKALAAKAPSLGQIQGAKEQKIQAVLAALELEGVEEAFESFRTFGLGATAKVGNLPVTTEEHASESTHIANASTAVHKAAALEHDWAPQFSRLARDFNEQAQRRGDPQRLLLAKDAHGDATIATNPGHCWTVEQLFSSMSAIARGKNQIQKNEMERLEGLANQKLSNVFKLAPNSKDRQRAMRRVAVMMKTAESSKQRDHQISKQAFQKFFDSLHLAQQKAGEARSKNPEGDLAEMGRLALRSAARLCAAVDGPSAQPSQEVAYALVKGAIELQKTLDAQWRRMRSDKNLSKMFTTRATFENWMLLGVGLTHQEFSSPEALGSIEKAVSHLIEMKNQGGISSKSNHNASREALASAVNGVEKSNAKENPLMQVGAEDFLILYNLTPSFDAPSGVELANKRKLAPTADPEMRSPIAREAALRQLVEEVQAGMLAAEKKLDPSVKKKLEAKRKSKNHGMASVKGANQNKAS